MQAWMGEYRGLHTPRGLRGVGFLQGTFSARTNRFAATPDRKTFVEAVWKFGDGMTIVTV